MSNNHDHVIRKIASKVIVILVIFFAGSFLLSKIGNVKDVISVLLSANLIIVMPLFGLAIIMISLQARILYASLRLTGARISFRQISRLWLAQYFVNTMLPSGFFSGLAYLLLKTGKLNGNKTNITLGVILSVFIAYITALFVFIGGSFLHLSNPDINPVVKVAAQILAVTVGLILIISIIFIKRLPPFIRFLYRVRRKIGSYLPEDIEVFDFIEPIKRAGEVVSNVGRKWILIVDPIIDSLSLHSVGMIMLWLSFGALNYTASFPVIVAGYMVGMILSIVSITPAGIGFVEVIMPIALNALDVPLSVATAATIIWRLFTVWLILGAGGVAFRAIEKQKN